jgi:hypothetical protein
MSHPKDNPESLDVAAVLRGNYDVGAAKVAGIRSDPGTGGANLTAEMERRARERIGGSIAFVTRLGGKDRDPLLWDGDE